MLSEIHQSVSYSPAIISSIIFIAVIVFVAFIAIRDRLLKPMALKELKETWEMFEETDSCEVVPVLYASSVSDARFYRIKFPSIGCKGIKEFHQSAYGAMKRNTEIQIVSLEIEYQNALGLLRETQLHEKQLLKLKHDAKVEELREHLADFEAVVPA